MRFQPKVPKTSTKPKNKENKIADEGGWTQGVRVCNLFLLVLSRFCEVSAPSAKNLDKTQKARLQTSRGVDPRG